MSMTSILFFGGCFVLAASFYGFYAGYANGWQDGFVKGRYARKHDMTTERN